MRYHKITLIFCIFIFIFFSFTIVIQAESDDFDRQENESASIFSAVQQTPPQAMSISNSVIEEYPEYCSRTDRGVNLTLEELNRHFDEFEDKYQIPASVLKAVAYQEGWWKQYSADFGQEGKILIHKDGNGKTCGVGMMQLTGDTAKDFIIERLITDQLYNFEAGVQVLYKKWSGTPIIGNNERYMLENWYYAIWGYNGGCFYNYPDNTCNHYPEELILPLIASSNDYWTGVPVTSPNIESFKFWPKKIYSIPTPTPIHYTNYWWNIGTYQGEEPHTNSKSQLFLDYWNKKEFFDVPAFNKLGVPFDDGKGKFVHNWDGVILQNFRQAHPDKPRFGDGDSALALNKERVNITRIALTRFA